MSNYHQDIVSLSLLAHLCFFIQFPRTEAYKIYLFKDTERDYIANGNKPQLRLVSLIYQPMTQVLCIAGS